MNSVKEHSNNSIPDGVIQQLIQHVIMNNTPILHYTHIWEYSIQSLYLLISKQDTSILLL